MKRHQKDKEGKQHPCSSCDKSYHRKSTLLSHQLSHEPLPTETLTVLDKQTTITDTVSLVSHTDTTQLGKHKDEPVAALNIAVKKPVFSLVNLPHSGQYIVVPSDSMMMMDVNSSRRISSGVDADKDVMKYVNRATPTATNGGHALLEADDAYDPNLDNLPPSSSANLPCLDLTGVTFVPSNNTIQDIGATTPLPFSMENVPLPSVSPMVSTRDLQALLNQVEQNPGDIVGSSMFTVAELESVLQSTTVQITPTTQVGNTSSLADLKPVLEGLPNIGPVISSGTESSSGISGAADSVPDMGNSILSQVNADEHVTLTSIDALQNPLTLEALPGRLLYIIPPQGQTLEMNSCTPTKLQSLDMSQNLTVLTSERQSGVLLATPVDGSENAVLPTTTDPDLSILSGII